MHQYEVIGEPRQDSDFVLATMQYGHFDWTKKMLDSVSCATRRIQIVLLDQGSSVADYRDTLEYVRGRQDIVLLRSERNIGIPAGYNTIIRYGLDLHPVVVITPNDVVYRPDTLDALLDAWADKPFESIVSASSIWMGEKRGHTFGQFLNEKFKPTRQWTWTGFNGLITQEFIDKVGWYDENLGPWWWNDTDILLRIFKAGCIGMAVHNSRVWFTEHSTKQESIAKAELSRIYKRNMLRFAEKHGLAVNNIHEEKQWQYHYAVTDDGRVVEKEKKGLKKK